MMYLYSDSLTTGELESIASAVGARLDNFRDWHGPRARRCAFVLRPDGSDLAERWRLVKNGRRVHAMSWSAHYVFMRAVLLRDPDAHFRTAIDHWRGLADFDARAFDSAWRNVGSMMCPESYVHAASERIPSMDRLDAISEEVAA